MDQLLGTLLEQLTPMQRLRVTEVTLAGSGSSLIPEKASEGDRSFSCGGSTIPGIVGRTTSSPAPPLTALNQI